MPIAPRSFRYELDPASAVATLTLDRPDRLNALTFEVYDGAARRPSDALDTEPGVRAILITGSGRAFCSGGDVEDIIGELFARDARGLLDFTRATGALSGRCALPSSDRRRAQRHRGRRRGGDRLRLRRADRRREREDRLPVHRVGLSGADMGASWLLPRIVGLGRAMELLLSGDFVDAATAGRIGLYHAVVPVERCLAEARARAERLAAGPSFALETTKKMLYREAAMDLDAALAAEVEVQAICMQDPNFREAYEAFRGKRAPRFG